MEISAPCHSCRVRGKHSRLIPAALEPSPPSTLPLQSCLPVSVSHHQPQSQTRWNRPSGKPPSCIYFVSKVPKRCQKCKQWEKKKAFSQAKMAICYKGERETENEHLCRDETETDRFRSYLTNTGSQIIFHAEQIFFDPDRSCIITCRDLHCCEFTHGDG